MLGVDATGYVSSYPGVDLAVMEADKTGDEAHERLVLHQGITGRVEPSAAQGNGPPLHSFQYERETRISTPVVRHSARGSISKLHGLILACTARPETT
jgi:hypothetical protein